MFSSIPSFPSLKIGGPESLPSDGLKPLFRVEQADNGWVVHVLCYPNAKDETSPEAIRKHMLAEVKSQLASQAGFASVFGQVVGSNSAKGIEAETESWKGEEDPRKEAKAAFKNIEAVAEAVVDEMPNPFSPENNSSQRITVETHLFTIREELLDFLGKLID